MRNPVRPPPAGTREDDGASGTMTRLSASLGSVVFLLVAPAMIAGVVPWWMTRWQVKSSSFLDVLPLKVIGVILIGSGLVVLLDSFARFALQGIGTPAPTFPTRHLVVTGLYRRVRNPIYLAVTALILGQGLLFASVGLIAYAVLIWICFHLFVVAYEEPTLKRTFGTEYDAYCANVPRWLPRIRPWS
jgi:protein-S-isoprenylcysteine O-methyltransferase Ste14